MMKIGEWLVKRGVISSEQLEQALVKQTSLKEHKMIGQLLVDMGFLSMDELIKNVRDHIEAKHTE